MGKLLLKLSALLAILASIAFPAAFGKPKGTQILELSSKDKSELKTRLTWVRTLVKNHYGMSITLTKASDLKVLQRVLDEKLFSLKDTVELQTLGLAFGNILVDGLGYHWVIVSDEFGRDFAVRFQRTSKLGYPLTVISKRVERGQQVDLAGLYQSYSEAKAIPSD